ncbi:penicillin-binding protein 1B [Pseudomonadota bacterium]|nr:penicillin-binding protein 1B [Pseudomonadota bacterium]
MFISLIKHVSFWALLVFLGYWIWLDKLVYDGFEKLSWTMPTKVFGKSLELYPGSEIDKTRLIFELEQLGYFRSSSVKKPGEFAVYDDQVVFLPRENPSKYFTNEGKKTIVRFSNSEVISVFTLDPKKELLSVELEPILIGLINTKSFEDRKLLRIDEIPTILIDTLIAVEDKNFETHMGFDMKAVLRAMIANFSSQGVSQGGSTLTQQLVKNFFLTRERTLKRKFTELLMSISLELRYSKDKILEAYCNEVFLGQDGNRAIHGFGLASFFYFGKPLNELKVTEIASLVALVKGPSIYNPRRHPEKLRARRNIVLKTMVKNGVIKNASIATSLNQKIIVTEKPISQSKDSEAFIDLVRIQLKDEYSENILKTGGLNIYTTFDLFVQKSIRDSLNNTLANLDKRFPLSRDAQSAVIVIKPFTGELLAMIGDVTKGGGKFNRAIHSKRQIGSMIKPFIYSIALDSPEKFNLLTEIDDTEISWKLPSGNTWEPSNYNNEVNGRVTLLDGLVRSLNLATVDLGSKLGVENVVENLKKIGFPYTISAYPSILLGATELTPLQLTSLYTTFLNDGFKLPIKTINSVRDQNYSLIRQYPAELRTSLSPQTAALIHYALVQVTQNGTAKAIATQFPDKKLAGKTGTSDNFRDSWFIGLSSNYLATVWIGHDDNRTTGLSGSSGALQVWSEMMNTLGVKSLRPMISRGIVYEKVNLETRSVTPKFCKSGIMMPFATNSFLKKTVSCEKNIENSVESQLMNRRKIETEKSGSTLIDWLKGFF